MINKRTFQAKKSASKHSIYTLDQSLDFFCNEYVNNFSASYDESMDLAINISHKIGKLSNVIKGSVMLPHGTGKTLRIMAIVEQEDIKVAQESGATHYGSEDMIDKISQGFTDFDICFASHAMMPAVTKIAKILGPRGLMPNPRSGTVSNNVSQSISDLKKGMIEFKMDKAKVLHVMVGKISFASTELKSNIMAVHQSILNTKPSKWKGELISSIYISSSQGPALKLDLKSFVN